LNPESIANERHAIQIVDTLESLQDARINGLDGDKAKLNRTVMIFVYK
jgi:hypothetical protein